MFIDQMPETTFEVIDRFTSITEFNVTAAQQRAGEACDSGQEGRETHDDDFHILVCTHDGNGNYSWKDTGRILSR